ncbi:MAG: hypothetical protein OXF22_08470 [Anaerolineaceae bacterium]|nr:hypothetical protein [Anaerolineaceae bacterium]
MSAKMSKEAFQRFTLLYLIGQFPEGIYSSFRLQKVLYYATCDVDPKPFTFHHTRFGQYSYEAGVQLTLMLESGIIQCQNLGGEHSGAHWRLDNLLDCRSIKRAYKKAFPQQAEAICASVKEYGFMRQRALDDRAHADPILVKVPRDQVLHEETPAETIESPLSEDQSEDIELALTPRLLSVLKRFTEVMENTDFDDSKVRVVDSLV